MVEYCQASHDLRCRQSECVARWGREGQAPPNLEIELIKSRQISQQRGDFEGRFRSWSSAFEFRPLTRKSRAPRCTQAPEPIHFRERLVPPPRRRQTGRDQAQEVSGRECDERKGPAQAGPFLSGCCLVNQRSSRFDAGGVNASQIASGRIIQNNIGMTHLAFARHGFGRETNAGMKRLFRGGRASRHRCLSFAYERDVMDSALRRTRSIRYPLICAGVVQW